MRALLASLEYRYGFLVESDVATGRTAGLVLPGIQGETVGINCRCHPEFDARRIPQEEMTTLRDTTAPRFVSRTQFDVLLSRISRGFNAAHPWPAEPRTRLGRQYFSKVSRNHQAMQRWFEEDAIFIRRHIGEKLSEQRIVAGLNDVIVKGAVSVEWVELIPWRHDDFGEVCSELKIVSFRDLPFLVIGDHPAWSDVVETLWPITAHNEVGDDLFPLLHEHFAGIGAKVPDGLTIKR